MVALRIPPLRERREDIPLLAYALPEEVRAADAQAGPRDRARGHGRAWRRTTSPGNVRELENVVERGVALTAGERIEAAHLPEDLKELTVRTFRRKEGRVPTLDEQEESYIKWVLKEAGGNRTLAAQKLDIDRVSLWRKLRSTAGKRIGSEYSA